MRAVCAVPKTEPLQPLQFVSGSSDKTLKLWNVGEEDAVMTFSGHTGPMTAVCMLNDTKQFVSGSNDKTLKLWNIEVGDEVEGGGIERAEVEVRNIVSNNETGSDPMSLAVIDGTRFVSAGGGWLQVWKLLRKKDMTSEAEPGEGTTVLRGGKRRNRKSKKLNKRSVKRKFRKTRRKSRKSRK